MRSKKSRKIVVNDVNYLWKVEVYDIDYGLELRIIIYNKSTGKYHRLPWIGATAQSVTPKDVEQLIVGNGL